VDSHEAKTRWPQWLRGEAVADLAPAQESQAQNAAAAVDEMLVFMQTRELVSGINIKALIDEGRA
jgi:antitoxin (DNA-binding transcriptional repressor) of toxin-antitoxin stability system